jgi:hypothetical protein
MADGREVPDATFACPDLTTFTRLDELGLEVIKRRAGMTAQFQVAADHGHRSPKQ